jgi:hypothetical protein
MKTNAVVLLTAAALTLAACSRSPAPRFYVLTALEPSAEETGAADLAVGVGPVTLAPHLDRPQLVTRDGNELRLGDFDRWGEPLREGIARVLAENLARLLGSDRIWTYPWRPAAPVDVQVTVEVTRCDAEGGEAVLAARWAVFDGGEMRLARRSSFRRPASGYPAAAAALSEALAELSGEIAAAIRRDPDP